MPRPAKCLTRTAIGVKAARECRRSLDIPMVILGTAHPVKFPEAVEKAGIGKALSCRSI